MTVGGVQKTVGDAQIYGTYITGWHWADLHNGFWGHRLRQSQ